MTGGLSYLAFSMGLLSSFHCIGMCGPIAMALPIHKANKFEQIFGLLSYNIGRAFTYSVLGIMVGFFGSSISFLGYFRYLSIISGLLMLGYVFWPTKFNHFLHTPKIWQRTVNKVKRNMSNMLQSKTRKGWFMLGTLNGLLPCGMIYIALISSVATGSSTAGGFFMLLFGLGTMPAMMAVGIFKHWLSPTIRTRLNRATPIFIAFAGIWLVVRGALIQYPITNNEPSSQITVCHGE